MKDRMSDIELKVNAKHEEKIGEGRSVSREFSRNIDIPMYVDSKCLQCTLSNDGILQIEAAVPVPAYDKIRNSVNCDLLEDSMHSTIEPLENLLSSAETRSSRVIKTTTGSTGRTISTTSGSSLTGEFKVVVDDIAGDYTADEIGVRVRDRKLLVTARHESNEPGRRCFREFCREFELPSRVKISSLSATLEAGQLVLKAPYSSEGISINSDEHHIPVITHC